MLRRRYIWGYQYVEKIEKVQTKFCKKYCSLSQNTADFFALGECGRMPLCISYMPQCIKYWLKLITMAEYRYHKQRYKLLYRLDEAERKTWATNIRVLLYEYGFGFVWISQDAGQPNLFIKYFTERIKDFSRQNWYEKVNSSSKAELYGCYKTLLNTERYIFIDMPYHLRKAFARFRSSSHDLMVERGRHINLDREFRYCYIYYGKGYSVVETEYHFLF